MRFLSVCSGIEAASVAWNPLGFKAVGFSEIEKFPCEVLKYHYPTVTNYGSITDLHENEQYRSEQFDVLVGGTPCQSFSVAGRQNGLADERGKLLFSYLRILAEKQPRWMVWENVPGVLSTNKGRDFGAFLYALGKCGYGYAYRVLDAQYFGVPQRRRRVFVVGYLGDWRSAAAVLFESKSLCRPFKKIKEPRQEIAGTITSRTGISLNNVEEVVATHPVAPPLLGKHNSSHQLDREAFVTHTVSPTLSSREYKGLSCGRDGLSGPAVISIQGNAMRPNPSINGKGWNDENISFTLTSGDRHAIAFHGAQDPCPSERVFHPLGRNQGQECCISNTIGIRRLTLIECERLQGFPDNYTQIPWRGKEKENCPDGHRYKALGNSMAVPVMKWIGSRLQDVDSIKR